MPEHVHLIIWPQLEPYSISQILWTMKQSVARKAVNYLQKNNLQGLRWLATGQRDDPYRFWLDGGGYDRNIKDETLLRAVTYIHANPVRRGLVARPQDWLWSSYRGWAGLGEGPVPIDKASFPLVLRL
jgi:putative transposase